MKYRKKPVVIEAEQYIPGELIRSQWLIDAGAAGKITWNNGSAAIHTLEGVMDAKPMDWIIKGVQGEIYPCKPDIFEATYEPVPEQDHA